MSIMRGCSVHGKNVGLHGDKTSSGAQCIAARPGMSVMGLLKLYIGDKTTPLPEVWGSGGHYGRRSPVLKQRRCCGGRRGDPLPVT